MTYFFLISYQCKSHYINTQRCIVSSGFYLISYKLYQLTCHTNLFLKACFFSKVCRLPADRVKYIEDLSKKDGIYERLASALGKKKNYVVSGKCFQISSNSFTQWCCHF